MCDLCEKESGTKVFLFQEKITLYLCEKCHFLALHNPFNDCENYVIARALLREYVLLGREIQYSQPTKILKKRAVL